MCKFCFYMPLSRMTSCACHVAGHDGNRGRQLEPGSAKAKIRRSISRASLVIFVLLQRLIEILKRIYELLSA